VAVKALANEPFCPIRNDKTAWLCERLKSRSYVWRFPDSGAFLRGFRAKLVADNDNSCSYTDPDFEFDSLWLKIPYPLDQFETAADGSLGVILMRYGITESGHHPVTQILGNRPVKFANNFLAAGVVCADEISEVLGIEARRQRCRSHQIAEKHSDLAALAGVLAESVGCRRKVGAQGGDGVKQLSAVPDNTYAKFL
jgi:hypothetical protein